ncbi:unnamed protein product [Menidia menidia]|uniref:ethanolamine kinase n=1 Tax=Menidia menidia TaxID=238744 RepID=A0A8S4AGR0_9TELE|nr:unnamed protein product [Menidia menidia]
MADYIHVPDEAPAVPKIDVTMDEKDYRSGALQLMKELRPNWKPAEIKLKFFTDGITNKLLGCYVGAVMQDVVLVRVYGNKTELLVDRENEVKSFRVLQAHRCAPSLYCTFNNGLCYQFLPGAALEPQHIRSQPLCRYQGTRGKIRTIRPGQIRTIRPDRARLEPLDRVPEDKLDRVPKDKLDWVPVDKLDRARLEPLDQARLEPLDRARLEPLDRVPKDKLDWVPEEPVVDRVTLDLVDKLDPLDRVAEDKLDWVRPDSRGSSGSVGLDPVDLLGRVRLDPVGTLDQVRLDPVGWARLEPLDQTGPLDTLDRVPEEKLDRARSEPLDRVPVDKLDRARLEPLDRVPKDKLDRARSESLDRVRLELLDRARLEPLDRVQRTS